MPVLEKDRYISMTDGYAKLPMLVCAMPGVSSFHADEPALDCLADILGGGNTSILYQRLVKTQKALNASASNPTDELAGTFQFSVMPRPGISLADMEKEIREAIKEFETRGVTDDDLSKFKQSVEANTIYGLESVSGKVSKLASYETFTGNANYIKNHIKRYNDLTKADIVRVYNKYIKNKSMVILSVLTKTTESLKIKPDDYNIETAGYKAPNYGYDGLKYIKAKDNFTRSEMPGADANPLIKVPPYKRVEKDEMKMIFSKSDETPTVVISLGIKGGRLIEQKDLSKVGISNLFNAMMDEDTKKHTAEEISTMLDKLGSSISFSSDIDETTVNIRCLKKTCSLHWIF